MIVLNCTVQYLRISSLGLASKAGTVPANENVTALLCRGYPLPAHRL
jgi:hypothetical protein